MWKNNSIALIVIMLLTFSCNQQAGEKQEPNEIQYTSLKQNLEQWHDMKFGMFVHWGVYSNLEGRWKGKMYNNVGEWIMHSAQIPVKEYEKEARRFKPTDFSADEWVGLAKNAGMKYFVFTAKHHDGFALWNSKAHQFNFPNYTEMNLDPVRELSESCNKMGIAFGAYYSQYFDWHEKDAAGNFWDWDSNTLRDFDNYFHKKVEPQVKELLTNYGPLITLWYDNPAYLEKEYAVRCKELIRESQPWCITSDRVGHELGDYDAMGDMMIISQVYPGRYWETPATINNTWGYKNGDENWKSAGFIIHKLVDIISKGGNLLLNVGPDGKGRIPEGAQKVLLEVGGWLAKNGEAVYGTGYSPLFINNSKWRITTKPGKLYLHVLEWPDEPLEVTGIENTIKSARFLENSSPVSFKQEGNKLTFKLPEKPIDMLGSVIVLDIEPIMQNAELYTSVKITRGYAWDDPQIKICLPVVDGRPNGYSIRYEEQEQIATNFKVENEEIENEVRYSLLLNEPGEFLVDAVYSLDEGKGGSEYTLEVAGWHPSNKERKFYKGIIEDTKGKLDTMRLTKVNIFNDEIARFRFYLSDKDISSSMRLKSLILKRIE